MFVPGTQPYWSEYKVMYEGLQHLGYNVEVRSSHTGPISSYMTDTSIQVSANGLAGGSYAQFKASYQARFGGVFQDSWSPPGTIVPTGLIQEVEDLTKYRALVLVGGLGALPYRYDGSYTSPEYAAAAGKLQQLSEQALSAGTPILAQCHAGTLPLFFRDPATVGAGPGGLGTSILSGRTATAYPLADGDTAAQMASLGVTFRSQDPLVIDGPASGPGAYRVITSRDWYPQTVAHAARALANALRTYPPATELSKKYSVLIVHGGAINTSNCPATNKANDIPCNYGTATPEVIPADYTTVRALLEADSPGDAWSFQVSDVNISAASLPFNPGSTASVRAYLAGFDTVVFFKHWNTNLTPAIQSALQGWVDDGGGLVGLHHALYNDATGGLNKNTIVGIFGAESSMNNWSARNPDEGPYTLINTSFGHFIGSHGVPHGYPGVTPPGFVSGPALANPSPGLYPAFSIVDELYNNMAFSPGVTFGDGVNQVQTLYANNLLGSGTAAFTSGFARLRDINGDGTAGRVVYLEAGERRAIFAVGHPFAQVVRNAVLWSAQ
jgi:putative intracellular protease/amidase